MTLCCSAGAAEISSGSGAGGAASDFAPDPHAAARAAITARAAMPASLYFTLRLHAPIRRPAAPSRNSASTSAGVRVGLSAPDDSASKMQLCTMPRYADASMPGSPPRSVPSSTPWRMSSTSCSLSRRVCAPTRSAIWSENAAVSLPRSERKSRKKPRRSSNVVNIAAVRASSFSRAPSACRARSRSPKKNSHWDSTTRR